MELIACARLIEIRLYNHRHGSRLANDRCQTLSAIPAGAATGVHDV